MSKGLVARKRFCVGETSKEFQKKWGCNLKETEIKYQDLLLEEYCNNSFLLMDSFWVETSGKRVDICWLVKVKGHLHKVEKEQQRIKRKKLSNLPANSIFKKMVFERFNEHLSHFQFKADLLSYCSSQYLEFETIYTLTTLNRFFNNREKINNAFEICEDEFGLPKVLDTMGKRNEKLNSTENLSSCEKEGNVLKGNKIASQIGVRIEGKFVSKNVINLSRRNFPVLEISLLSKGLKFVPTANTKKPCEIENRIRRIWKETTTYVAL